MFMLFQKKFDSAKEIINFNLSTKEIKISFFVNPIQNGGGKKSRYHFSSFNFNKRRSNPPKPYAFYF